MDLELVSIIVPCFNQGSFIQEALASILKQTHSNWECIIVNDGSTDESPQVIAPFLSDHRFQYYHQSNAGVAAARNFGLRLAKGNFIQFLDADDLLESEKLAKQIEFLKNFPEVDIIFGSSRYFVDGEPGNNYPLDRSGNNPTVDISFQEQPQAQMLVLKNFCTICAPLYRRRILDFSISFEDTLFEDWLFHLECALCGLKFHFERIPGTSCHIRMTDTSQMQRHKKSFGENPDIFPRAIKKKLIKYNSPVAYNVPELVQTSRSKTILLSIIPPIIISTYIKIKKRIF